MKKVLKRFGKYLLLDRLAQGGMAEIYRAWAPSVDGGGRLIVLKCVQGSLGQDPDFIQMFRAEIRLTMGLNHPNIVQLYDFGEAEGRPYIAMELIDGKTLKAFRTRLTQMNAKIAPEYAAYIISQAAAALHYAHISRDRATGMLLNIIHRDVSPQNLILSYEGNVKIIDFGVAKAANNRQTTRAGIIKGKPSYLSPEQIEGLPLDGRSDIFSLGAVLWETLVGKKLFNADSDLAVIRLIEECDKSVSPPSQLNPEVPRELDEIVLKALAKNRDDRFKTAEEMQRALHRFIYAFKPDFDPADLAKYIQQLFKAEIEEEQRSLRELNVEAKELFQQLRTEMDEPEKSMVRPSNNFAALVNLESVPIEDHGPKVLRGRLKIQEKIESPSGSPLLKVLFGVLALGIAAYVLKPDLFTTPQPQEAPPPQAAPVVTRKVALKLNTVPQGGAANVLINQEPIDPSSVQLTPGSEFKISITKAGFKPYEKQVTVPKDGSDVQLTAELEPTAFGLLTLRTIPTAEAQILHDGMTWARSTPIQELKLPPGEYQIQLSNKLLGMQKNLQIKIIQDQSITQDLNLDVVK